MEKKLIGKLATEIYYIKAEKGDRKYNFISYEMILPNEVRVNMIAADKNAKLAIANKIIFENKIKQEN